MQKVRVLNVLYFALRIEAWYSTHNVKGSITHNLGCVLDFPVYYKTPFWLLENRTGPKTKKYGTIFIHG